MTKEQASENNINGLKRLPIASWNEYEICEVMPNEASKNLFKNQQNSAFFQTIQIGIEQRDAPIFRMKRACSSNSSGIFRSE